jgi:NAD(P)-dependent dehydrogenase (short-subunit alcohol dehydrogenase family)
LRQVESCMKRAADLHGGVSGVANCVGSLLLEPVHLLSEEDWDSTLATKPQVSIRRGPCWGDHNVPKWWIHRVALDRGGTDRISKP